MKARFVTLTTIVFLGGVGGIHRAAWADGKSDSSQGQQGQNGQGNDQQASNNGNGNGAGGVKGNASRVVVRGWEIQSISSVKRLTVTEVDTDFENRSSKGKRQKPVPSTKGGGMLVVLVQCKWATAQPPNEPLWTSHPDVVLVDDVGFEYPPVSKLMQDTAGGDYVTFGMPIGPERRGKRPLPGKTSSVLVCFDVPTSSRAFWLRLPGGEELPINQVGNLPQLTDEID